MGIADALVTELNVSRETLVTDPFPQGACGKLHDLATPLGD